MYGAARPGWFLGEEGLFAAPRRTWHARVVILVRELVDVAMGQLPLGVRREVFPTQVLECNRRHGGYGSMGELDG